MMISLPDPVSAPRPPALDESLDHADTIPSAAGEFAVKRIQLTDGPSQGVELLMVQTDRVRAAICPTRGMSLWKANIDGLDCGWRSPVEGPVHPSLVPLSEGTGLGWLDGFDELLVRCGMRSFGAPDFDAQGNLLYALHGRVGNLPARNLRIEVNPEHSLLEVSADVHESRFLQWNLRLTAKYIFAFGEPTIEVHDTLRNAGDTATTAQMLYHVNVGPPFLGAGSKFRVQADRAVARDAHAASGVDDYQTYLPPTPGYQEQVYFSQGRADDAGWSRALLSSADQTNGFAVHFHTDNLPFFSQWKNTVGVADGYVTGLEPGTGFPNPRSFEADKGRLVDLSPGESLDYRLRLEVANNAERLIAISKAFVGEAPKGIEFDPDWCLPR